MIDLVAFKVFAILMCRGSTYDKALTLFNMSFGLDRKKQNVEVGLTSEIEMLTHNSSRL